MLKYCWSESCKFDFEKRYLDVRGLDSRNLMRVVVLTHSWGGGTELFENELLLNRRFDFIFLRVKNEKSKMMIRGMLNSETTFYSSKWFEPKTQCIEEMFLIIPYDLLLIDFILPIPQLIEFLQSATISMVYVMHDHHAINYDIERDMHLDCNITGKFGSSLNISSIGSDYLDSSAQHRRDYESVLRRCFAVSTPSQRNKAIFRAFFPDIVVYSSPNRPAASSVTADLTLSPIPQRKGQGDDFLGPIRVVVLGALSVGKGSHIVQDVSNLCAASPPRRSSIICNMIIYHIGTAANYRRGAGDENHVVSLGAYNTSEYLQVLLASIQPHYIWFPANRHESYCYMLDNVIYSGYPIIAADTGSFPERMSLRPDTYIGNGCMVAEEWAEFILEVHRSRARSAHTSNTTSSSTTTAMVDNERMPTPYDFESFAQFLHTIYLFLKTDRSHHMEDWKHFFSFMRKRKFVADKKKFLNFTRKIKLTKEWDKLTQ